jgi:hypothetical protein
MWLAHFLLHLVHGGSLGLVVARAASDLGLETAFADHAGHAMMAHATSMATASLPLELLLLDAGLLLALYLAWRVAGSHGLGARRAAVAAPWGFLAVCLYLAGVWIAFQPMQMRGMAG